MICAIVVGYHMVHLQQTSSYAYRIEVNRIMEELQAGKTIDELNIKAYQTITAVTYLDANDKQTTQMVSFYEDKDTPYVIMPWMKDGQIEGYLRFDYHIQPKAYFPDCGRDFIHCGGLCFYFTMVFEKTFDQAISTIEYTTGKFCERAL